MRFLSSYHRMVLAVIGPWRFLGKAKTFAERRIRCFISQRCAPIPWIATLFLDDTGKKKFSGKWLFGSSADVTWDIYQKRKSRILELASAAANYQFEVNGCHIDLKSQPNLGRWDVDPVSGKQWPHLSVFRPLVDMPGDIRFPWELGRLHHLVWFGQAWRYTKQPVWADSIVEHVESILSEAPFERGIHWRDGLQLAVRVYSLVAAADLLHDAPAKVHRCLNNAVAAHGYALSRQISPHSEITNNHVIGEACAITLVGLFLDNKRYIRRGQRRLKLELQRQLYSDGVPYEGSVPYIRFDLDFVSLLGLAIRATSTEGVPDWLLTAVEDIAYALSSVADVNGEVPPFGDGDDARVLRFDEEPYLTVNESLAVATVLTGRPFSKCPANEGFAYWVGGPNITVSKRSGNEIHHLPESGLIHLRRASLSIWLDCGPTGFGMQGPGGHGHNDTTSLVVHLDGTALLHDPGWYTYYGNRNLRDRLRSTGAHNTVTIDGQEQAELGQLFEILNQCKPTEVRVRCWGNNVVSVSCGHTGYTRLGKGIRYRRRIILKGEGPWLLRVSDFVLSRSPVEVKAHLGSDLNWENIASGHWCLPNMHQWHLLEDGVRVYKLYVPCSRKTGVLQEGSALEWNLPLKIQKKNEFRYMSRWQMRINISQ